MTITITRASAPYSDVSRTWTPGAADKALPLKSTPPDPTPIDRLGPLVIASELDEPMTWADLLSVPTPDGYSFVEAPWGQPVLRRDADGVVFSIIKSGKYVSAELHYDQNKYATLEMEVGGEAYLPFEWEEYVPGLPDELDDLD